MIPLEGWGHVTFLLTLILHALVTNTNIPIHSGAGLVLGWNSVPAVE